MEKLDNTKLSHPSKCHKTSIFLAVLTLILAEKVFSMNHPNNTKNERKKNLC